MPAHPPPARRRRRTAIAAVLAALFPLAGAFAAGSPIPELRPSPRAHGDPPMRILRVVSSDPGCQPDCPEWISAEGAIAPGSAAAFAKVLADLNGRRLPVLISSRGGSVRDALTMGAMIRARGLAVAVARTLFANCPERARACPDPRGQAIAGGTVCASACPLILAGGVVRLVGPAPLVGVHEITTIMKETEGVEGLTKTVKLYQQDWVDRTVETYLTQAGVGDPVMTLMRKTPASSIRWLSLDEIKASGLATGTLDAAAPILASGANGLDGRAFDEATTPDIFHGEGGGGGRGRRNPFSDLPARRRRAGDGGDLGGRRAGDGLQLDRGLRGGPPVRAEGGHERRGPRSFAARALLRARRRGPGRGAAALGQAAGVRPHGDDGASCRGLSLTASITGASGWAVRPCAAGPAACF